MIYEKRLLVLVGESSGCLRLERTASGLNGRLTGNVRDCVLAVRSGKRMFAFGKFDLPPAYAFTLPPDIDPDSLVVAVGDLSGRLVMSGGFRRPMPWRGNLEDDVRAALRICGVAERSRAERAPQRDINEYFLDIVPQDYDDGRIAEVNYYRSNLTGVSSDDIGVSSDGAPEASQPVSAAERQPETAEAAASVTEGPPPLSDGDHAVHRKVPELGSAAFYDSVSDQIDKLFARCERYEAIEKLLPDSRWVKVDYDASGRYYLVGLIGDPVRYICYGVPGEYSPHPPSELAGYCQWLALDENDPAGKGFWVMYQDAVTGKSIL